MCNIVEIINWDLSRDIEPGQMSSGQVNMHWLIQVKHLVYPLGALDQLKTKMRNCLNELSNACHHLVIPYTVPFHRTLWKVNKIEHLKIKKFIICDEIPWKNLFTKQEEWLIFSSLKKSCFLKSILWILWYSNILNLLNDDMIW